MKRLKKTQLYICVCLITLFVFSISLPEYKSIFFLSIPMLFISIHCLYDSVRCKNYVYLCLVGLVLEIFLTINISLLFGNGIETSWRALYNKSSLNEQSIRYIFSSLLILLFVYYLRNYGGKSKESSVLEDIHFKIPQLKYQFFELIFGVILLYYLSQLNALVLRSYASNQNVLILCLFRACLLIGLILQRYNSHRKFLLCENFLAFIIVLALTFRAGLRYLIVEWFVLLLFLNLSRIKKIKLRNIIVLAVVAIIFYISLVYIKAKITGGTFADSIFRHERNLFYSLNALIANIGENYEMTYFSTIKNILPKALTGSSDMNTGGILMKYISPSIQSDTGINMGGFYLTEAYANIHGFGIYLSSIVIGIFISTIEKKKNRKFNSTYSRNMFFFFYLILISQMYSVVCYGSSNYIKLIIYIMILAFVVFTPISVIKTRSKHPC